MHDPSTVAWNIPAYPRNTILTIWHEDPCTDGSDDSCGWFMRARHGNPETLEKIRKAFAYDWDTVHNHSGSTWYAGWFNPDTGLPIMSVQATALEMFRRAVFIHFGNDRKKTERFMRRNLYGILSFAENTVDSMRDGLIQRFGRVERSDRIEREAAMIYGWILRAEQPWYRHPRWHVHHWRFQIHPWQQFRRWLRGRTSKPNVLP